MREKLARRGGGGRLRAQVDNERASKRAKRACVGLDGDGDGGGRGVVCRKVGGVRATESCLGVQSAAGAHTGRLGGDGGEGTRRCRAGSR